MLDLGLGMAWRRTAVAAQAAGEDGPVTTWQVHVDVVGRLPALTTDELFALEEQLVGVAGVVTGTPVDVASAVPLPGFGVMVAVEAPDALSGDV